MPIKHCFSISGYDYLNDTGITDKEILDAVKYHHAQSLKNADIEDNSLPSLYITLPISCNIAAIINFVSFSFIIIPLYFKSFNSFNAPIPIEDFMPIPEYSPNENNNLAYLDIVSFP